MDEAYVAELEWERDDLRDYINRHIWIDTKYIETFVNIAQKMFLEQLEELKRLIDSEERFNENSSYDDMVDEQRKIVYDLACCLISLEALTIPDRYYNFYMDEIENKYKEVPEIIDDV